MNHYAYSLRRIIGRRIDWMRGPNYEEKYYRSIYYAYTHWCQDIMGLTEDASRKMCEELIDNMKKSRGIIIPRLIISITDYCTLKCKECSVLMPYLSNRIQANAEQIFKDIDKLLECIDECICLEFIGGEPLLHPELDKLLRYAQNNKKIKMVEITTNATLVPNCKLLDVLKNEKTLVQISDYEQVEYQKVSEYVETFRKNGIKFKIFNMKNWYSYGNAEKRNRRKKEIEYSYYYCNDSSICRTMYEGKLFVCGRATALFAMGKLKDDSSYLEIRRNNNLTGEDILKFFAEKKYAEACDFCDVSRDFLKVVEVAEQF